MILDEDIKNACESSVNMTQAAKKLGISLSYLSRRAKKIGCYNPKQCWNKGLDIFKDQRTSNLKFEEIFCKNSNFSINRYKKRLVENGLLEYKCSICDLDKWMGNEIVLELDHINGINNDNRMENLRFLCPNCHSQTDTFRGRNTNRIKNIDGFFKYSKEEFINAVSKSSNIREVCIMLGLTPKGGNYETVRLKMNEFKLNF